MNNKEVAHLWANKSRPRATGSHFYFEGDTIYSYGSHFPIARHYKGVVLFTTQGHSVTTSKHKGYVRQAISHLVVHDVDNVMRDPSSKDLASYKESIRLCAASRFNFSTRFEVPTNFAELKAKAALTAAKERRAATLKREKSEAECAKVIVQWLAGESVQIPYGLTTVYLRANACYRADVKSDLPSDAVMQTSKGATVPLSEAERAFRFAIAKRDMGKCPECSLVSRNTTCPKCVKPMEKIGWHRNGDQFKVGDYQLDAINQQGIIAGCHRITWPEIERFAKLQGWIK